MRCLLRKYEVGTEALESLEEVLEKLAQFGRQSAEIVLDCGLNRGLYYYTGMMFEISCARASGDEIQLCGGGRYDNLVSALGGNEPTAALGFAWGIERIASVLEQPDAKSLSRPQVLVVPLADADFPYAAQVAGRLRKCGMVVETAIDERSLRRSLKYADRKDAAIVAIIGEDERKLEQVVLRDMRGHRDLKVDLDAVESTVASLLTDDNCDGE